MTEAETSGVGDGGAGGDAERGASRGAGFPMMDLATAVELIHRVGEHGGDFSTSAFAQYCGHSTANSGPFRTKVASLKDWALVTTKDGRVLLTDLGKAVAKSPDPMADDALLRRAFDSCKIFKAFYDNTAKGVALKRETLGRAAVFDHKVSAKSQERFVAMIVDSAAAVGLATPDIEGGTVTFKAAAAAMERFDTHEQSDPPPAQVDDAATAQAGAGTTPGLPPAPTVPVLLRQVWPTATGEVVLAVHSTEPLPASAFALVGHVVQAAEELAKSIGLPVAAEDDVAS